MGRRGGGVIIYAKHELKQTVWNDPGDHPQFELLWVHVQSDKTSVFVGGLYHPPNPIYNTAELILHTEGVISRLSTSYPQSIFILAGDFNKLPIDDISTKTGLLSIISQPTRGANILDQILISHPGFTKVQDFASLVKTDHKAIIASGSNKSVSIPKNKIKRTFPPRTPSQHAAFLNFLNSEGQDMFEITSEDAQKEFDRFYKNALMLLDKFYPEKTVTISTRDPPFVTPGIKAKLKIKNKLMRAGRIEEANAMTVQIGKEISRQNAAQLSKITNSTNSKQMWKETAKYTKQSHNLPHDSSKFNAEKLNSHYASISTDPSYTKPINKHNDPQLGTHQNTITEYMVFKLLDTLKITATGLLHGISGWERLLLPNP